MTVSPDFLLPLQLGTSRRLSLPLLVLRVLADHPDDAPAPHDFALGANFANRRTHFHGCLPGPEPRSAPGFEKKQFTPDPESGPLLLICTGKRSGRESGRRETVPPALYPRGGF